MPNWCENDITLIGPKDVLEEIMATELLLKNLIPWPKEIEKFEKTTNIPKGEIKARKELEKKYGVSTLYDWCITYWGTKWDIDIHNPLEIEDDPIRGDKSYSVMTSFSSAWSPPVKAFKTVYERYKDRGLDIVLYYFEAGCAFLGSMVTDKGKVVEEEFEYKSVKELADILEKHENPLAENELEYLREVEAENEDSEEESVPEVAKATKKAVPKKAPPKKKTATKPAMKVAAKKATPKKASPKKVTANKPVPNKVAAKKATPKKKSAKS